MDGATTMGKSHITKSWQTDLSGAFILPKSYAAARSGLDEYSILQYGRLQVRGALMRRASSVIDESFVFRIIHNQKTYTQMR